MKKAFKELFKDWKMWAFLGFGLLNIVICIREKDFTEALWCLLATILYFIGGLQDIGIQIASQYIDKQEDSLMKADAIIKAQTELIKELNDKLDEQTKSNENGVRDTELDQSGERSEKNMG